MSLQPIPEDWQRGVAVVAHPDDLEYGCASAIARWTAQGRQIAYVLASSGEAGIEGRRPEEVGPLREAEERASAAIVGVREVEFLGLADGLIEPGLELRRRLASAFRRLRPEIVLTMNFDLTWGESPQVNHSDHRAVGLATLDACRDAANSWVWPELGERWAGVKAVYVASAEPPTHFVDVGETLEAGIASLREHRQYIDGLGTDFDPATFLRNMAEFAGAAAGCSLAVLFRHYQVG
ncbi:MAG TPA: PIG-L deacetylase family protein [Candidatus Dormibacteraeota bacterium]|jgi:LmbE family N-acetylglucosaminyl deacetylase|nr:PIG-L deacetylase family protein [Candidatus Dormibacteraeota bacterium]